MHIKMFADEFCTGVSHTFCRILPKLILGDSKAEHAARPRRTAGTLLILVWINAKNDLFLFRRLK